MLKSLSRKKQATAVVVQLIDMSLADVRAEWQKRYGPTPKQRAGDLLRRVLAWRIQADAFGDLDAATRRILAKEQNVLRPAPARYATGPRMGGPSLRGGRDRKRRGL
jgi:hypothetical protein